MFRLRSSEIAAQTFADQFEADGMDYVYRKNSVGAPVRVSAKERARFIERFKRDSRLLTWGMVTLVVGVIAGRVLLSPDTGEDDLFIWTTVGVMLALFMLVWWTIWNAPVRALERRAPIGRALDRKEKLRKTLDSLSWGLIASILIGWIVSWLSLMPARQSPWWYAWAGIGVLIPAGLIWRAWQKWRLPHNGRS